MSKRRRKTVFTIFRLILCAVFITIVVRGVSLHDRVTIKPDESNASQANHVYRLISEQDATVTIMGDDGREETLPRERIALDESGEAMIERGLAYAWTSSDSRILFLALLAFAPVGFIQSLRFMLLLRAQEIRITYWECLKLTFGGNFLNFVFMIGSTAGDVFKAYYTSLHTTRKTEAVTTILLDRIVGMTGLLIVAGTMSFVGTADPMLRRVGQTAWVVFAIFAASAFVAMSRHAVALRRSRWITALPGSSHLERIHDATQRLIRHRGMLAICLLLSTLLQFVCVGSGTVCAYALHMDFSGAKVWDYLAFIGAGNLIAAIPISVMGIGTMEFAYKHFFLDGYGTLAQLLCLALWVRLVQLAWALPGALVTLSGAHRPRELNVDEDAQAT